jgi:rod shape-determining protein MreD
MSFLVACGVLLSAALAQVSLWDYLVFSGVHLDLVLVLVLAWAMVRNLEEGTIWALIGGLCLDLLSGTPFGVFSIALVVVMALATLVQTRVFGGGLVLPILFSFPLSLLFNGLALLMLNLLGRPVAWISAFEQVLLPAAGLNTGAMVVLFPLVYLLNRRLNPQPLSF